MTALYMPMQEVSSPTIRREFGALILFCMLGLGISLAVLPWFDADAVGFILNHVE
jgi:hypothetical protein